MGLLDRIITKKNKSVREEFSTLDKIKEDERIQFDKMMNKEYYFSTESKNNALKIKDAQKNYLKNNPNDFLTRGANFHQVLWEYIDHVSEDEKKIFELTGKGLYYEQDLEDYDKAIEIYTLADNVTMDVLKNEIQELIDEYGDGDYLYTAKIRQRIRVCNNKIERVKIKKLENKAEEIEKNNPKEAIKKYEELNMINPGLKKYDKKIFKILESEAKELEKTNPKEAIKKYEELNKLNPGLKKYNKRIELCAKKLD